MGLHSLALTHSSGSSCGSLPVHGQPSAPPSATRPSSLGCYPFYKTDPFIFLECPHVYFCGNTPSFGSKIIRGKFHLLGAPGLGCH